MTTIETSVLTRTDGSKVTCTIVHGWNPKASLECDTFWKQATLELLNHIMAQNYNEKELIEVVSSISMEDDHWSWFDKATREPFFSTRSAEQSFQDCLMASGQHRALLCNPFGIIVEARWTSDIVDDETFTNKLAVIEFYPHPSGRSTLFQLTITRAKFVSFIRSKKLSEGSTHPKPIKRQAQELHWHLR